MIFATYNDHSQFGPILMLARAVNSLRIHGQMGLAVQVCRGRETG